MLNAYAGKVINGKPALTEIVVLPENADIIIMVMPPKDIETSIQANEEKDIAKRRAIVEALKGILPPDVDLEAMRAFCWTQML